MSDVTAVPLQPTSRRMLAILWIGIAALILFGVGMAYAGTRTAINAAMTPAQFLAANGKKSGVVTTASGLEYQIIEAGSGPKPGPGDMVVVDYEGRLVRTGAVFDSSAKSGGPATLPVSGLIPGWVEGLQLMSQGAKFRFWIPPELAYGPQGTPGGEIPPDSALVFDVTLRSVMTRPAGMPGTGATPTPPQGGM